MTTLNNIKTYSEYIDSLSFKERLTLLNDWLNNNSILEYSCYATYIFDAPNPIEGKRCDDMYSKNKQKVKKIG